MQNFWGFVKTIKGMRFWTLKTSESSSPFSGVLLRLFLGFLWLLRLLSFLLHLVLLD